ncbi:hypothetical protein [Aeribacillus composti]|nr:hypothetical protein [Aeribacillus composti]
MKKGECCICEGWIYWNEVLVELRGKQYCEACYEEQKGGLKIGN